MNTPNPFVPQGILIDQKNRSRTRLRLAVFSILGVPVLGLLVLLITQGCRREQQPPVSETGAPSMESTNLQAMDTNPPVALPTNPPVYATPTPTPTPTPTAGSTEYTVAKGDTFSSIGKKFNVSTKSIQDANPNIDPRKLQVNQKLMIPAPTAPATAASGTGPAATAPVTANGEQVYIVKSGDTLSKIAKESGVNVKTLEAANPKVDPNHIKVGDRLKIPVKAATPAPAEAVPAVTTPVTSLSNVPTPVK